MNWDSRRIWDEIDRRRHDAVMDEYDRRIEIVESDKEIVLGLLNQQLEKENQATQEAVFDDPDCALTGQENTALLIAAINLLGQYEWDRFEDPQDEIPF